MKRLLSMLLLCTFLYGDETMSIYDINVKDINGNEIEKDIMPLL